MAWSWRRRSCGWSETQQQHSNWHTKRTKIWDVTTCRIFARNIRKRGIIHCKNGETVAGVRLYNNTASTKQSERRICMTSKPTKNEKTDPSNFRKLSRKWGVYHGDTVAGAVLRQQHRSTKPEKKPSWNVCSNGHNTELLNWYYAGLRVLSKTSGLPIVGDSKNYTRQ